MSVVFISYRRLSALVHARAVYERLSRELGPGQVFIDLDDMEVGVDFVEQTNGQLAGCRVLLALIDPDWATATDNKGQRRLDRSNDFVRIEIATALRRGIRVVPILLGDAEMPEPDALPDDLKPLARRHALALDFRRFDAEVARLVTVIRRILADPGQDTKSAAEALPPPPAAAPVAPPPPATAVPREGPPASQRPAPPPDEAPPPVASPPPAPKPRHAAEPAASPPPKSAPAAIASTVAKRIPWPLAAGGAVGIAVLAFLWIRPASPPQPAAAAPAAQAPPVAKPTRSAGEVFRDCPDCPEMVVIPAGSFLMGSPPGEPNRQADEGPQRRVSLRSFALGKTEVTQGQWKALMGINPSRFTDCGDACPVERVSWNDAQEYVKRLSAKTGKQYALPSEAQWEYAARAGTATAFSTGDQLSPSQATFASELNTAKVASFAANAYGLYDMHGNVFEWVQDCYAEDAYARMAPNDGSAYEAEPCRERVLRGGSWYHDSSDARAAYRKANYASSSYGYIGLRVCRVSPAE